MNELRDDQSASLPQIDNGIPEIARKSVNERTKKFGPIKETVTTTSGMKLQAMQNHEHQPNNVKSKVLLEWEASKPSLLLKLEAATTTTLSLMEELLMTAAWEAEWLSLEGIALLRLVVRVVTSVEPGLELWVGKDFVCLIDLGHLLLCFLRTSALLSSLVGVV